MPDENEPSPAAAAATESVGAVSVQTMDFAEPFVFANRQSIPQWRLAYETYGTLNADASNAVLVCHALSGNQHAAGWYADAPKNIGWWDNFIGPNKPLDTNRFFVISPNNLGGCHGSSGPQEAADDGTPYGSRFPLVTVEDWVRSQKQLVARLGVRRLAAVVGGSLGGMQALRWAIDYPDDVDAVVMIAVSASLTALNIAFNEIARRTIISDPNFNNGDYYQQPAQPRAGLGVARMLGHITYLSDRVMGQKFGRSRRPGAGRGYDIEFEVESYLRYQGDKFSNYFDANTYLLMTRALDYFDPAADADGDLVAALAGIAAKCLLISFSSDWRFPPSHSRDITKALLASQRQVSYLNIDTHSGHDSFLLANEEYHNAVRAFMSQLAPAAA